jgi:hypothetical protein
MLCTTNFRKRNYAIAKGKAKSASEKENEMDLLTPKEASRWNRLYGVLKSNKVKF